MLCVILYWMFFVLNRSDSWQLVQSECLPSSVNNVGCSPFQFHESTIYSPVNSSSWTRVTVQLPDHVSSGYSYTLLYWCLILYSMSYTHSCHVYSVYITRATQFRWIQKEGTGERQSWGVDHVYIGEACPRLCSGHGYCTSGVVCICDEGYHGGPEPENHIKTTPQIIQITPLLLSSSGFIGKVWKTTLSPVSPYRWWLLPLQHWPAQLHQGQFWVRQCVSAELAADPGWWSRQRLWAAVTTCPRGLALLQWL